MKRNFHMNTRTLASVLGPDTNSFGVIRLAMAVAVLISHSYWFIDGSGINEPLVAQTGRSLGEYAVQVFFFLSGVLVTQSALRSGNLKDFVAARFLRIFPGLCVCILLTAFVLGPSVTMFDVCSYFISSELPSYVIKTITLTTGSAGLPGVFIDLPLAGRVNVSLWTLKYEVLCYAGLALIAFAALRQPRRRSIGVLILALLLVASGIEEAKPADAFTAVDNIRYFSVFFATGALAYLAREKLVLSETLLLPLFALFVATLGTRFATLSSALFLGYMTLCVASWRLGGLQRFCNRQDLSYGVYIYAGPVQQTLIWLVPKISPLLLTITALPISLTLAALSWNFVEHPALRLRSRAHSVKREGKSSEFIRRPPRLIRSPDGLAEINHSSSPEGTSQLVAKTGKADVLQGAGR